jgi:hypothetical protein
LAARVTEKQPIALAVDRHRAMIAARDAAPLAEYRAALNLGRLHVCGTCAAFQFGTDPAALGHCARFGVETWPFVPFWCAGFDAAPTAVAPAFIPDPIAAHSQTKEHTK